MAKPGVAAASMKSGGESVSRGSSVTENTFTLWGRTPSFVLDKKMLRYAPNWSGSEMLQSVGALYAWFAEGLHFVRLLFLIVGVGLTLDTARRIQRDSQLRRFGLPTKGRIVGVSSGEDYDTAIVGFTDAAGRPHEFDSELPHMGAPIGATVDVRYDPKNPRRAHVAERPLSRFVLYFASLFVGAGFIFFSAVIGG